ncbi:hypothetical protein A2U01_0034540 [Trifolium medium]|uniref:CCHC-type domain-containing protein n=1 Tax=Trifolium medium TaxID=97028 RepID=A0A392PMV1_9FABA|nr:hypothetical protein [Trifolium medium]
MSLISRRISQIWRQRKNRIRNRSGRRPESSSGPTKPKTDREVICFECQDPRHYISECPTLADEKPKDKSVGTRLVSHLAPQEF